jgi:Cd2+/Zn2+-exporting ATPase
MKISERSLADEHRIYVNNLCCSSEESLISGKLNSLPGIVELQFNVVSHQMTVRHTNDIQVILTALQEIGMNGILLEKKHSISPTVNSRRQFVAITASGILFATGEILSLMHLSTTATDILFISSIIAGGLGVFARAIRSIRNRSVDINLLMTVAVIGAVTIGQLGEGAAVIVLFALSLVIESKSLDRTRKAIETLMTLSPPTALVKSNTGEVVRAVGEIGLQEIVIVKPGDRIPVDGIVCNGTSTVDESTITGEPFPEVKMIGNPVFAGTFNQRGTLEIRVTKLSSDTTFAKIIQLVEDGLTHRARSQSSIDRFARYYTPFVFIAAICLSVIPVLLFQQPFQEWFYRSLVLLVISCPCALVISTPITIVSGLTNAARNGILIKGGIHLEELSGIRCIAFDKTGTLTHGRPTITAIHPMNSVSAEQILQIAVSLERRSEHPLAGTFINYALSNNISIPAFEMAEFKAIPGKGIQAMIEAEQYSLGSHRFAEELGLCSPEVDQVLGKFEREGNSVMLLANAREVLGIIVVQDEVRKQGKKALNALRTLGIKHIALLTGDDKIGAAALGDELPIDESRSGLLPGDKVLAIKDLQRQYGKVAMVGDGINDAPALANADVGIAMGGASSDTALETADVVLMADDLAQLPFAVRLSKVAISTIKQNIVFALVVKAIFIALGVLGFTTLWLAILADDGVTLLVALNGLKLLRLKQSP